MRRLLPVLFPILILTGCVGPQVVTRPAAKLEGYEKVYLAVPDPDPRAIHPKVLSRLKQIGFDVVEIKPDGPPVDSQGSGFVITPQGDLLTAAHVLEGQTNASIWIEGKRYLCSVIAMETNVDLALMRVQGDHPAFRPVSLTTNVNYRMGADVFTMGFPLVEVLGTAPRLNKGLISSTVGIMDDTNQLQVSVQIQPGNSGGPLLNERGDAIGVMVSTLNPLNVFARSGGNLPQNVNFAVKMNAILRFLADAKVELPAAGAETTSDFEQARQSLALVRGGNVTDEDLKRPSLLCHYGYISMWDMYYRFRAFEIEFLDMKEGDTILKAGQYTDNLKSEEGTLNSVFEQIYIKFHPDRPNPFKK